MEATRAPTRGRRAAQDNPFEPEILPNYIDAEQSVNASRGAGVLVASKGILLHECAEQGMVDIMKLPSTQLLKCVHFDELTRTLERHIDRLTALGAGADTSKARVEEVRKIKQLTALLHNLNPTGDIRRPMRDGVPVPGMGLTGIDNVRAPVRSAITVTNPDPTNPANKTTLILA